MYVQHMGIPPTFSSLGPPSWPTSSQGTGMMSYPNFNGGEKAIQYVDFRLVAEEAERAGVDMRFVYLARSAAEILTSDSEHHNYGGS